MIGDMLYKKLKFLSNHLGKILILFSLIEIFLYSMHVRYDSKTSEPFQYMMSHDS
jgi:hypothetical protein